MSRALYVIIFSRGSWWVDFEGEANGPHATLELATEAGLELARVTAHSGRAAELRAPDDRGSYLVVWDSERQDRYARESEPDAG